MSDRLAARIRTAWPMLLGHVVTYLAALILRLTGIEVDSVLLAEVVSFAASWAIWELGTRMEASTNTLLQSLSRWLVSLGQDTGSPTYGIQPERAERVLEYHPDGSVKTVQATTTWPPATGGKARAS